MNRLFLLSASSGLIVIALAYGLMPAQSLPFLFDIDPTPINVTHIFRAVMGLYLGFAMLWLVGAFNQKYQLPALYSLVVFMVGLAFGRLLSMTLDGMPNGLLIFYLFLEFGFGILGVILIKNTEKNAV
ncbi:DUF4345 domain-containing protein [Aliivibrio sifiae]